MNARFAADLKKAMRTAITPAHAALIQRKCACGGSAGMSGECAECGNERLNVLRPTFEPPDSQGVRLSTGHAASLGHDFDRIHIYANERHGGEESRKSRAGEAEDVEQDFGSDVDEPASIQEEAPPSTEPTVDDTAPVPLDTPIRGPAAPAVKIVSKTVATAPASRTRKKIGIGEEVLCSTDPATNATWSVTGGGSVTPTAGNSTTFTASKSPSNSNVKAAVGTDTVTVDFEVIAPDGMTAAVNSNPGNGTAGPPNNQIGFKTIFDCIVKPATVSFYRVEFRENIPKDDWTWPDGTADSNGPRVVPWNVGQDNKTTDSVTSALRPIGRINDGTKNVNFGYTIRVPEDYKDEAGTWVTWLATEEHYKQYAGATQKGRATLKATNNVSGTWQGPWQ